MVIPTNPDFDHHVLTDKELEEACSAGVLLMGLLLPVAEGDYSVLTQKNWQGLGRRPREVERSNAGEPDQPSGR